jgi:hypothetical protein
MRFSPVPALQAANHFVNTRVDATPASRERTVDFLRVFSICVVVLWHWALSCTHRADGRFVMPNPIDDVPMGWLATWVLQVMPVFFLVGGFANLAAWESGRTTSTTWSFLRRRLRRLLLPTGVFVAVWAVAETSLLAFLPGYRTVLEYGLVVFTPLWFLAAYLWVTLLVPLTAAAHRRAGVPTVAALGTAVVLVDVGRFAADVAALGLVNTVLVWVFVHQLGYFWRDGTLDGPGRRWAVASAGLAGLSVVASLGVYSRSMVTTASAAHGHMFPTTAGIATLAVFQLGVVALLRPTLASWLARRRVWKVVVAVNSVIMTIFLWHMTALLLAVALFEWVGLPLYPQATDGWWVQRPLWLLVPGAFLAALIALFAPVEQRAAAQTRP